MKPSQLSIRWLLEVTVVAAVYALFVRGAVYADPPYSSYWRILLLGLTLHIVFGSFQALANGTFFHDGGKAKGNPP